MTSILTHNNSKIVLSKIILNENIIWHKKLGIWAYTNSILKPFLG